MILKANPEEIKDAGKKLVEYANEYITAVKDLYGTVDGLKRSWQGKDNQEYIATVYSYKDNMDALGQVIGNYGVFLQETGSSLEKLQADIAQEASQL